jgi:1-acyl-sn-glycerol-3-phosphate acyltransferase
MLKWHFREIKIKGTYFEKERPILLIGNHFSWWDGFIANYLNNVIFRRRFHIMMLEEQLEPRPFLNKAGAYSIRKKSRDIVESLNYTRELLDDKNNLVAVYPQGEIQSLYHYPLEFQKGITSVLNRLKDEVDIVFLVALVDYFSHRKPALTLGLKVYKGGNTSVTDEMEEAYNDFMKQMIREQNEKEL